MMPDAAAILLSGAVGLLIIGLGGMILSNHLFRMILALAIAEAGANLMLVIAGYRWDAVAPIVTDAAAQVAMVDPVPQAMVLTAIVISFGMTAFVVILALRARAELGNDHADGHGASRMRCRRRLRNHEKIIQSFPCF